MPTEKMPPRMPRKLVISEYNNATVVMKITKITAEIEFLRRVKSAAYYLLVRVGVF